MRRVRFAALIAIAAGTLSVTAQSQSQAPAAKKVVAKAIQSDWASARRNIAESAQLMPEDKFMFKPVDSVRTFGAILAHLAGANYVFCASAKAVPSPHAEDEFEKGATTRAAIIKALNESLVYCDDAYAKYDDAQLAEMVKAPFSDGQQPRAQSLIGNTSHKSEHYGNLVTYFRINGIVPPSSRPR